MTVNQAAIRYRTDAGAIWAWIAGKRVLTSPEGRRVVLVATRENDSQPWDVSEREVD